ncbi:HlyD family efflux transporter periplasmic adaptor subunit [Komarekiella sp. 'clone 1']|uniref:HlyD family efflux transporter periplasmic adaptor subunit n=1 Tax=Komarekiella delphini-convector SJRDD-AB1 TaxID=2593771 RepID=A0AA40VTA7_9NOST|nr:HlyD family efflux transporter periplasmic adaptor subunit [Komarekiella delphini-convector]MBD6618887.1 HlyD family efflux transporter periplasmic adaptor subunit [Komarekiella delphini-convector SJRDD-AB1]
MPNTLNGSVTSNIPDDQQRSQNLNSSVTATLTNDWSNVTKESLDSFPKVWTRGLLYFLVVFVSIVLPWAILFKVDETGTARGQLEPQGNTVRLDAAVEGIVTAIRVKEGDVVKDGQTLLVLESELVNAELRQAKDKLEGQLNRRSQSNLLKNQLAVALATQRQQNQAQELEKLVQIDQARQSYQTIMNSYNLQKEEKLAQLNQAKMTLEYNQNVIKLVESSLVSARKEVERFSKLNREGIVSEIQVVDKEDIAKDKQKIFEQNKSDIEQAKLRFTEQKSNYQRSIRQAKADIDQARLRLEEQERSYRTLTHSGNLAALKSEEQLKNLIAEITTLQAEIAQTKIQIKSLEFQLKQRILKAPVSGTVFKLPIEKAGSLVQPGTMVSEIAPINSPLIIRAQMPIDESGFLQKGLPVKLKFDAFPFQDYGVIEGKLLEISPTTIQIDTSNGKVSAYDLKVALNQNCITTANKCADLRPGDTATVEVIVRQRRIIDFILDPFKKLQQGGVKL